MGAYIPAHLMSTYINTYISVVSRESEFLSQFADAHGEKVAQKFSEISGLDIYEMDEKNLLGLLDANSPRSKRYFDEYGKTGTLSSASRDALIQSVLSGSAAPANEAISTAMKMADAWLS